MKKNLKGKETNHGFCLNGVVMQNYSRLSRHNTGCDWSQPTTWVWKQSTKLLNVFTRYSKFFHW